MRLGGAVELPYKDPEEWVKIVKELRYSAVLAPVDHKSGTEERAAYKNAASEADLLIGEVGVWRNCLSTNDTERRNAMEYAKAQLDLADELHACCCVNIIGSASEIWDGFSEKNYSEDFYALAVDSVREIIDAVDPKNTFYTIEPMPWMVPDSPEAYLKLIKDVGREAFAVHLDFVNMINCPERYCRHIDFIGHCFDLLGPYIKSIHGKDVIMEQAYTTLIHETRPGGGVIDYRKILPMVERLGPDTPLFVEHLSGHDEYKLVSSFVRSKGEEAGILIKG